MHFFNISDAGKNKIVEWAEEMDFEDSIICPDDEGHQRAGKRNKELIVKLKSNKVSDFLWTWYNECIITERVAKLFYENKIKGFELSPVHITNKEKYDNYSNIKLWELKVTAYGGFAHQKSGIKVKYKCDTCDHIEYSDFSEDGLFVDEQQWDGSDIFIIWPLPTFIIVNEKVKTIIENNSLSNVKIIRTDKLKGEGEDGSLTPGLKEEWFS